MSVHETLYTSHCAVICFACMISWLLRFILARRGCAGRNLAMQQMPCTLGPAVQRDHPPQAVSSTGQAGSGQLSHSLCLFVDLCIFITAIWYIDHLARKLLFPVITRTFCFRGPSRKTFFLEDLCCLSWSLDFLLASVCVKQIKPSQRY